MPLDHPPIKAVFFDLDNTLFNQSKAHKTAISQMKEEFKFLFDNIEENRLMEVFNGAEERAIEEFRKGKPLVTIRLNRTKEFLESLDLDVEYADEFNERFYELYPTFDMEIEGAKQLVRDCSGNYSLGVISNGSKGVQCKKLRALGIEDYFENILLSEEIGIRKPDPGIFLEAIKEMGGNTEECLMVGDSYHSDIVGAKEAGMKACWFNPSNNSYPEEEIVPDFVVESLDEVFEILF